MHIMFAPVQGRASTRRVLALVAAVVVGGGTAMIGAAPASASARADAMTRATLAHLDNPYVAAKAYVNPNWAAKASAEPGGSAIANQPTGVWLDSIAAIAAPAGSGYTTSLRGHLDNALAQSATLAQFVLYDLPSRDCQRTAHEGELGPTEIDRYRSEFIDPIAAIEGDAKYSSIRIVNIVEPASLPSLISSPSQFVDNPYRCDTMKANGNYQTGIAYALGRLHAAGTNIYNYLDAANHGWIGWNNSWDNEFAAAADLMATVAKQATGGVSTVDGFIANLANYGVLKEPFLTTSTTVNGTSVKQSNWVDWNGYVDESTFAKDIRVQLVTDGFNSTIGMLIDTSRNGWGGPKRPTKASTSTDLNTWVDASRVDRRTAVED